jgi:phospholipase D1/2
MHQFIVSMERIAAQSAWTGMNRSDSFAPLRVNVAAQWLVDGVSQLPPARSKEG